MTDDELIELTKKVLEGSATKEEYLVFLKEMNKIVKEINDLLDSAAVR